VPNTAKITALLGSPSTKNYFMPVSRHTTGQSLKNVG
jgi:hypothetical protein